MIITVIFGVFLHLLRCALTLIFWNDLLFFLEIIILESMMELLKLCSETSFHHGTVSDAATTPMFDAAATVDELVPTIHSLMVWKKCEALNLKAKYVPIPGAISLAGRLLRRPRRGTIVPVVRSFHVWKICQALDLPATYDPQHSSSPFTIKQNKTIPVVHSIAVFKICNALNLRVELAPQ
ncbi:hypothetical protein TNIN_375811 [Trichonephila inaurata madagascariensis]|uniref:Uncharacterized protein n=1 Tax=Trichonephila inaurata madagascariensis TaxID=2747483 RepID=A0A8X6YC62_9ARAC|nr:hypothetical protein TNIN_375811 [Trichonephila inaurata madagascariensis]